jgi:hypothetical protein
MPEPVVHVANHVEPENVADHYFEPLCNRLRNYPEPSATEREINRNALYCGPEYEANCPECLSMIKAMNPKEPPDGYAGFALLIK